MREETQADRLLGGCLVIRLLRKLQLNKERNVLQIGTENEFQHPRKHRSYHKE